MKHYIPIEKEIIKKIINAHSSQDINNLRTSLLLVDYLDCYFIQEVIDEKAINIVYYMDKTQALIDVWKLIVPFFIILKDLKNKNLLLIVECPTETEVNCVINTNYPNPVIAPELMDGGYAFDSSMPIISEYYYELAHRKLIVPCPDLLALVDENYKTPEQKMHEEELQAQQKRHKSEIRWARWSLFIAIIIPLIVKFIELYFSKC